mmetsp:Transcript_19700/g.57225  ORF Transcript_19700/g.57225 Transcript_19700/m.57225 type:complete len:253 (-) Transcript_19700:142-900(-)
MGSLFQTLQSKLVWSEPELLTQIRACSGLSLQMVMASSQRHSSIVRNSFVAPDAYATSLSVISFDAMDDREWGSWCGRPLPFFPPPFVALSSSSRASARRSGWKCIAEADAKAEGPGAPTNLPGVLPEATGVDTELELQGEDRESLVAASRGAAGGGVGDLPSPPPPPTLDIPFRSGPWYPTSTSSSWCSARVEWITDVGDASNAIGAMVGLGCGMCPGSRLDCWYVLNSNDTTFAVRLCPAFFLLLYRKRA